MATIVKGEKVRSLDLPYKVQILRADPDFEREKRKQPEYEFRGRSFTADPSHRGAYE